MQKGSKPDCYGIQEGYRICRYIVVESPPFLVLLEVGISRLTFCRLTSGLMRIGANVQIARSPEPVIVLGCIDEAHHILRA